MAASYDGRIRIDTRLDSTGFNGGLRSINTGLGGITRALKGVAVAVGIAFGVKALINFSKKAIDLASDLNEVQNVVDTVFASSAASIDEFAKTAIEQFGLSELAAKRYASTMGAMLKSMRMSQGQIVEMSKTLTGLAGDMASFYNLDADEAFAKLRSGISGETEPLKQLGINLSQANLEAFALAEGLGRSYSKLSEAEKAMVRYNYILSVTSDAQGDFAKTSDSWANQVRILTMRWEQFMSIMGNSLITVLTPVLKFLNGIVTALIKFANTFNAIIQTLFGKSGKQISDNTAKVEAGAEAQGGYADSLKGTGDAAEKAGKQAKSALAGFDELNVLASQAGEGESPEVGVSGADMDFGSLDGTIGENTEISPKLLSSLERLKELMDPAIEAAKRLWGELKRLGDFTWGALKDFYDTFLVPVGNWILGEGLPRFLDIVANGLSKVDWQKINDALHELWEALAPLAINIGEGLLWFLENVLVPLGVWAMNNIVPLVIDALAAAFRILNGVINALKPLGQWLWESFLSPMGRWTGTVISTALELVRDGLKGISDWVNSHQKTVETFVIIVGSFAAAWGLVNGAFAIWNGVVAIWNSIGPIAIALAKGFGAAVAFLTSPVGLVVAAIGALIAIIVLLVQNWDTVKTKASEVWQGITELWGGLASWFEEDVWTPFRSGLKEVGNFFIKIINGMITGFEGFVNFLIKGINKIIDGFNEISFSVPDEIPVIGGMSWGFNLNSVESVKLGRVPMLATGAVIPPNQEFLAVLGDQKGGRNLEAPESLIRQIMREELAGLGTTDRGSGTTVILELDKREVGRVFLPIIKKEESRVGVSLSVGGVL